MASYRKMKMKEQRVCLRLSKCEGNMQEQFADGKADIFRSEDQKKLNKNGQAFPLGEQTFILQAEIISILQVATK